MCNNAINHFNNPPNSPKFARQLIFIILNIMAVEIKVPSVGESITEVSLVKWLKSDGDWVERDEVIAELESEKATFEINAEQAGVIKQIAKEGDTLAIGDVVCSIDTEAAQPEGSSAADEQATEAPKAEAAKEEAPKTDAPKAD